MNVSGSQASVFHPPVREAATSQSPLGQWTYRLKQRGKGALLATAAASTVVPATGAGALFFGFGAVLGPLYAWAHTRAVMRLGSLTQTPFSAPINIPTARTFVRYYRKASEYSRPALEAETRRFYTRFTDKNFAAVGSKIDTLSDQDLRCLYAYNRYLERGGRLNLEGASIDELCRKRDKYLILASDRLTRKSEEREPAIRAFRERLTSLTQALGRPGWWTFRVDDSVNKLPSKEGPALDADDWRGGGQPIPALELPHAAGSEATPLFFKEYFQDFQDRLRENKAAIDAFSSACHEGDSMAREPRWQARIQQQNALIEQFAQGLLRAARKGCAVIFPQYVRQVTPEFCWKTLGFEGIRALSESGSNILSVTFDRGAMINGHPSSTSHDWTQIEETLFSSLLQKPLENGDRDYHRFVEYALGVGMDIHFKPCNLSNTHREYYSSGDLEGSPISTVEERKKGWEESLLYRAARNLDLATMERLLEKGADPNVGRNLLDAPMLSPKKTVECSVLQALFEEVGKRPGLGRDFLESFLRVVGNLCEKGLRLDARQGKPLPDTSVVRDADVRRRLDDILRRQGNARAGCFGC